MAENIVTALQEKMGFAPFEKIDPNEPQGKRELWLGKDTNHFTQVASIAVLVGIYEIGTKPAGAAALMLSENSGNSLPIIFADKREEVIRAVSKYGDQNLDTTTDKMASIASTAIALIKSSVGENADDDKVAAFIAAQRHHILVHLPPDLHLGNIVNDNSIDDETNKMEGPVSAMVHFFESLFAKKQ
ncbi:MAG: hypothetical protein ABIY35_04570 [Chitinophagaceae bacterium]